VKREICECGRGSKTFRGACEECLRSDGWGTSYDVIGLLRETEPWTIVQIANELGVQSNAIEKLLYRMEKRGRVTHQVVKADYERPARTIQRRNHMSGQVDTYTVKSGTNSKCESWWYLAKEDR